MHASIRAQVVSSSTRIHRTMPGCRRPRILQCQRYALCRAKFAQQLNGRCFEDIHNIFASVLILVHALAQISKDLKLEKVLLAHKQVRAACGALSLSVGWPSQNTSDRLVPCIRKNK